MEQRKINYVGWVDHYNVGDEALFMVNKRIFGPYQLVPYKGKNLSKITLFGGGTLFPGWTAAIMPNRYNYAYGIGVRNPSFWGTFYPVMIEQIKRFNFRYVGVRGTTSKKLLDAWGINSIVVGDPCLLLEPAHYGEKEDARIGINVGSDGLVWGGNEENVFAEIAKTCRLLKKEGYHPVLIPFNKDDLPHISIISRTTNTEVFGCWTDIQKVLNFIASCHLLIGERLHSLVFSAATYTPFISIEYRPKCRDFAETVGFGNYNLRTDRLVAERVIAMLNDLSNNLSGMGKRLRENVEMYRRELRILAKCIKRDIESLQDDKWIPSSLEKAKWYLNIHRRILLSELYRIKRHQLQTSLKLHRASDLE